MSYKKALKKKETWIKVVIALATLLLIITSLAPIFLI